MEVIYRKYKSEPVPFMKILFAKFHRKHDKHVAFVEVESQNWMKLYEYETIFFILNRLDKTRTMCKISSSSVDIRDLYFDNKIVHIRIDRRTSINQTRKKSDSIIIINVRSNVSPIGCYNTYRKKINSTIYAKSQKPNGLQL